MRLSLGTAQFGLDYGVTNAHGQLDEAAIAAILQTAKARGVSDIDTAAAYGNAHDALARHANALTDFEITTKIPSLEGLTPPQALSLISETVAQSAKHLGPSLNRVLFHNAADVIGQHGLLYWQKLEDAAGENAIQTIGVSVYTAEDIKAVLERLTPQAVQLPINILDQRLLLDGSLEKLHARGCAVQARSIFLQGTLLAAPDHLLGSLKPLRKTLEGLGQAAQNADVAVIDLCLGFLKLTGLIDSAVVGVTTPGELNAICDALNSDVPAVPYQKFRVSDVTLIDPRYWRTQKRRQAR